MEVVEEQEEGAGVRWAGRRWWRGGSGWAEIDGKRRCGGL